MSNVENRYFTEEFSSRICSGDIAAYEEFVHEQWEGAVRTCWLILRNPCDAEEAAQDAFVNLYRARGQLKDSNRFRVWFYKILLNAARQQGRRQSKILFASAIEVLDPDDEIDKSDTRIAIRDAMHGMGKPEITALVLRYFCDLTDREASHVAGWPLGTYKWRLAKARRQIAKRLQDDDVVLGLNL